MKCAELNFFFFRNIISLDLRCRDPRSETRVFTGCRMILRPEDRPVVPHVRVSGSGCFPDIRGMMRKISPPRCNIGTATFHCVTHRVVDHLESNLSSL